jgi:predicted nucleic acid-binding protein
MTVISDNSPLSALAETGLLNLLQALYGQIIVPQTVLRESLHPGAPPALRAFTSHPPTWVQIVPDHPLLPETTSLDAGEAAAISLAWLSRANVLLIVDDLAARHLCTALGIQHAGTAGVLLSAALRGLVDFDTAINKLQSTRFRLSNKVVEELRSRLRGPVDGS